MVQKAYFWDHVGVGWPDKPALHKLERSVMISDNHMFMAAKKGLGAENKARSGFAKSVNARKIRTHPQKGVSWDVTW
jgi:hypothetical protein